MSVRLQIHGDLKDLLNGIADPGVNCRDLDRSAPVKDLIESQGVPHTEVGLVFTGG